MNKRNARQRLKAVLLTGGILLVFMVVARCIADFHSTGVVYRRCGHSLSGGRICVQ